MSACHLLQEVAYESEAQDKPRKVGKECWRTSGPVRKTREEDEHFLHASGKTFLLILTFVKMYYASCISVVFK